MSTFAGESVHLTSTHRPFDTRVFQKECRSLARAGYKVTLVVPHTEDVVVEGIQIRAVPLPENGRERLRRTTRHVYKAALKENPGAIFHFHDSELLPFMLLLKLRGRRVIYDAHEDTPRQMLYQHWIPGWLRRPMAFFMWMLEVISGRILDHIITAEPVIARHFPAKKTSVIRNYPMLEEFEHCEAMAYTDRPIHIGFAGGISKVRGITELVKSLELLNPAHKAQLMLAGTFYPTNLIEETKRMDGWKKIEFKGWLNRKDVLDLLANVRVGVITRHPIERHLSAFPTKLFEYMAAGLPVVVSDLPTIRPIIDDCKCGILINPTNPQDIAQALNSLLRNPQEAATMGQRGLAAVKEKYNWDTESEKLLEVYTALSKKHDMSSTPQV